MKFGIYSLRDAKTGFLQPTFEISDAVAKRNLAHAVESEVGLLYTHGSDFDLYRIGEFDSDSGRLIPLEIPEFLISVASIVEGL